MGVQQKIGDIQPFAELAQGATTVVYKGYQRASDRFVLLKVLRPGLGHDEERIRRFESEARLITQVQHPNIVAIYASGRDHGRAYLVAEFIDGMDLRALLTHGPLPFELAVFVVLEAARGLQAAHAHSILHRDLKPSNILVSYEGQVKLTDFGMASLMDAEEAIEVRGTPGYLAPELVRGEPPSIASDLFSLGATFYETLAGRPAFTGADTSALLDAVVHHDPLPRLERFTALPTEVHRICGRLLAKEAAARYPDPEMLIDDLSAFRMVDERAGEAQALKAYLEDPIAYRERSRPHGTGYIERRLQKATPHEGPPPVGARPPRTRSPRYWRWGAALAFLLLAGVGGRFLLRDTAPAPAQPLDLTEEAASRLPDVETSPGALAEQPNGEETQEGSATAAGANQESEEEPGEEPAPVAIEPDTVIAPPLALVDTLAVVPQGLAPSSVNEEPVPARGILAVAAQPWAYLYVEGDSIGQVPPILVQSLAAGRHRIVLKHPRFPDYIADVEIRPGETDSLNIRLWDLVGRYTIDAQPWAQVLIDGALHDVTPLHDLIVRPGERRLTLRHPQLGAWDTTLVVQGGEVQTLQVNLAAKRLRR